MAFSIRWSIPLEHGEASHRSKGCCTAKILGGWQEGENKGFCSDGYVSVWSCYMIVGHSNRGSPIAIFNKNSTRSNARAIILVSLNTSRNIFESMDLEE
jgi:hypothetical protein